MHIRRRRWAPSCNRGFSLLELLVVLSVLTMLLAVMVPSLRSIRRQAKVTVCQSNLRQIAAGWHMYLDAHNGRFYQDRNANVNFGGKQGDGDWRFGSNPSFPVDKPLNPYVNSSLPTVARQGAKVFKCPGDKGYRITQPTHFDYYGNSYRMNLMLGGPRHLYVNPGDPCRSLLDAVNERLSNLTRGHVGNESKLVLVGDSGWWSAYYALSTQRNEFHSKPCNYSVAFMDGHADVIHIRRGLQVSPDYNVLPFDSLIEQAHDCQVKVSCK